MKVRGRLVSPLTPEEEKRREKARERVAEQAAEQERARLVAEREETESWLRDAIGERSFERELRLRN